MVAIDLRCLAVTRLDGVGVGQHHTRCVLLRACARTAQVSIDKQPQGYTYEDGNSIQTAEATSHAGMDPADITK